MAEERVQRWLAAIPAADVVSYSRLMRADETTCACMGNNMLHSGQEMKCHAG